MPGINWCGAPCAILKLIRQGVERRAGFSCSHCGWYTGLHRHDTVTGSSPGLPVLYQGPRLRRWDRRLQLRHLSAVPGDGLRTHKAYCGANSFFAYAEKLPRISYPTKPGRGYQDQNGPWSDPACGVTFSPLPVERFRTCTLRIEIQTRNPAVTNFVTSRGPAATS